MAELKRSEVRLPSLESIRGVAALSVVLTHLVNAYYPYMIAGPESNTVMHSSFEKYIYGSPLFFFVNGTFGVAIFFILSGFVLSIGFFNERSLARKLAKNYQQLLKRYWRLVIPALGSIILAYVIIKLGLDYSDKAAEVTGSHWLVENWYALEPHLFDAIAQGVVGIFFGETSYNPVLWTMKWEFLGSMLVFAIVATVGMQKTRWVAYLVLILILFNSYLLGFVIGVVLADLYTARKLPTISSSVFYSLLCVLIIYFGGVALVNMELTTTYGWLARLSSWPFTWYFLAGTLTIWLALSHEKTRVALSNKHLVNLGYHTFSMYLLHTLLIFSISSYLTLYLSRYLSYTMMVTCVSIITLMLLIPITAIYSKYVDAASIRFSRWFAGKISK